MLRFFTVLICVLLLTSCRSGGGGGSGSGYLPNSGSGNDVVEWSEDITTSDSTSTPEPSTLILLGIGLAGLAAKMLIKKRTR